jgi:Rhs element Vgr protein
VSNESSIPVPATPDVCTAAVLVDGQEISGTFHLLSVVVTHELNRIPTAVIHFSDGEAAKATFSVSNTEHFVPGRQIAIQLGYRSQNETVFQGIIVKHSISIRRNGSHLCVECRDPAFRMTMGSKSRFYTDKKDSEIMEELIISYDGLQSDVSTTEAELQAMVQYEASDWDFLLCRAEANGMVVMVEDGTVRISPPASSEEPVVTVRYGATVLELDAEIDARWQSKGIKASTWNASSQELLQVDAEEASVPSGGNLANTELAEVSDSSNEIRHGGKLEQQELQAWADGRLLRERLAKVRGRVKFQGFAGVQPDTIIEVTGIGDRFEGRMYVSGVRHSLARGNWETDVQFGLNPELFAATYNLRPLPAAGLLPGVSGLQTGIVTALENDPEGEDRIKVRLPLVSPDDEGIWTRLATLDAGNGRGMFFRPELGDEVVVGFLNDDPRHPIILGMLHSSAQPSPERATDANPRKGYVSREKMQFIFDDEKKIIFLETPSGNKVMLSEEDKGIMIADQNGNKITLNDSGIVLESSKDLTLKAGKDITIEGMNIEVTAQTGFKAAGTGSAELSGASTTIKGSASTVIQGGIVQIN